jgi:hypothetical protein
MSDAGARKHAIQIRVSEATMKGLDALRVKEPDIPTRSEMARRLVERGTEKAEKKGGKLG